MRLLFFFLFLKFIHKLLNHKRMIRVCHCNNLDPIWVQIFSIFSVNAGKILVRAKSWQIYQGWHKLQLQMNRSAKFFSKRKENKTISWFTFYIIFQILVYFIIVIISFIIFIFIIHSQCFELLFVRGFHVLIFNFFSFSLYLSLSVISYGENFGKKKKTLFVVVFIFVYI